MTADPTHPLQMLSHISPVPLFEIFEISKFFCCVCGWVYQGSAGRMRSIAVDIDAVVGSCRMSDPSYDDGTLDNHRTVPHDFVPSLNRRAKETPASPLPPLPPQFVLSSLERGVYSGASMKGSSLTQSGTPNADKYAYDLSARPNRLNTSRVPAQLQNKYTK